MMPTVIQSKRRSEQDSCRIGLLRDVSTESVDHSTSEYQNRRHRRFLVIFVTTMGLVGVAVAIVLATVYGSAFTDAKPSARQQEGFTLDEVLSGKFYAESFNGTWISDSEFSYRTSQYGINIYDVKTSTATVMVKPEIVAQLGAITYKISHDRKYVLYSFDIKSSYRYSSLARYSIIDLEKEIVYPLKPLPNEAQPQMRYATWNKKENNIIYVYNNDIYFRQMPDSTMPDVRLTNDGEHEAIFNGVPDWVYEEEVLSQDNAIWIANSGARMVFASFDDRQVDHMEFSVYGEPGSVKDQYPTTNAIRYPKPGRPNPKVAIWSIDLQKDGSAQSGAHFSKGLIPIPEEFRQKDHYFTTVAWATDDEVMIAWLNRHQNVSLLSFCNITGGICQTEYEISEPKGWVDQYSPPKFSANGRNFLIILPVDQLNDVGNFKHLVLYDRDTKQSRALSSGRWEVTEILGWDEPNHLAYFIGTATDKPAVRHMYKVSTGAVGDVVCVTCGTLNADSKECTYNTIEFSTDMGYYVHGCDGPHAPRSVIREAATDKEVFLVSNNDVLRDRLAQKSLPRPLTMQVPLDGNYFAQVKLLLPPSLNRNRASQYPMLVYVYGGPNSQQVSDRYRVDWGYHLSTSRGVIYALIDGRGSGYQGDKMLHEIYRRMGTVEIQDQIKVAKFLKENLPFVDGNKTAIWGWSYGGYATASALAQDQEDVFKCGMSVAPVTNWIYYDSIYTERYMGLPTVDDNLKAYEDGDVCKYPENFRGKQFYLIHGTADDNVHYQQSLQLAKSLEGADVLFRQQSYTDENHSINTFKKHLYHSLGTFLMTDCFDIENEVWG
uniref:Venom dipeptidyl peptidase 4 n=1 Tax=Daphnia galeata TaxID=27404 RepID=A0A8J2RSY2_9CRUS|nr:unnamed protein product [Daphnia galeata]